MYRPRVNSKEFGWVKNEVLTFVEERRYENTVAGLIVLFGIRDFVKTYQLTESQRMSIVASMMEIVGATYKHLRMHKAAQAVIDAIDEEVLKGKERMEI